MPLVSGWSAALSFTLLSPSQAEQHRLEDEWRRANGTSAQPSSTSSSGSSGGGGDASSSAADGSPRTRRAAGPATAGASSTGGSVGGSTGNGELGRESEPEEEEEDDDDPYTDRRWRRVRAMAFGDPWAARLLRLRGLAVAGALSERVKVVEGGSSEVQGPAAVEVR